MTSTETEVLAVGFRERRPCTVWIDPTVANGGSTQIILAVLQLWMAGGADKAALRPFGTAEGREQFCSSQPSVELAPSPLGDLDRVSVSARGDVRVGRPGLRRLSVDAAATAATAALLRAWNGTIESERLGGALSVLRWDAKEAYAEVALYGVPYADRTQPITYYRAARELLPRPSTIGNTTEWALTEAEAAANELLFVSCANVFSANHSGVDSIFDSTFGVQAARAITTQATRFTADKDFLWKLAAMSAAGRRWRLAEREAGGQEPLGVAKIRDALGKSLREYGGPDQAFVNDSHLGEIALRAFFDQVPTSAGSRGARIPGYVFLSAGFRWALDEAGDLRLTQTQRSLLWSAFRAGVTYCDTQYFVEALSRPAQDRDAGVKLCPDCAEEIKAAARKCRFCGYEFRAAAPPIN